MALWLKYVVIAVCAYLLGNVSAGILISRLFGVQDIRTKGSGNAGSTNVLRTLGWVPSVMTLVGDCLKGVLAALLGKWLAGDIGLLIGGVCAVLGHDFPVFFKFKGGKGIATSWGVMIAISPWGALVLLAWVFTIVGFTGYMSVASISAAFIYPVLAAIFMRGNPHHAAYIWVCVFLGLLAIWCHRKNIQRLLKHEENKLDFKKISQISSKLKNIRK